MEELLSKMNRSIFVTVVILILFASNVFLFVQNKDIALISEVVLEKTSGLSLDSEKEAVYYGIPLTIHPSNRYYKFNRYDLDKSKPLDLNSPDSSFYAETDYMNISWVENGQRVFNNKWIDLIYDNPSAVFKITGEIRNNDCSINDEYCTSLGKSFIVIYDMEVINDNSQPIRDN